MEQIKIPGGDYVFQKRLANGLMVFAVPKPGFLRTYGVLSTNYGSVDSSFKVAGQGVKEVPPGIAHFLEHKLFEEETENIFTRFASWGASVNAFTSYTQTSYLFSTTSHGKESLLQLIAFVNNLYLTEDNVEKERGIIEQELQMYADQPDHRLHLNLLANLYHTNPVRLDIGGTVESVRQITVADLEQCYYTFYRPDNMALAVVGDFDPAEILQVIETGYPKWSHSNGAVERLYPREPEPVVSPWSEERLDISRPRYVLGFKYEPLWQGEELLRRQLLMSVVWRLIAGRSSQIYAELYEHNLIDDSFGASFNAAPQFAYSIIGSETASPQRLHEHLVRLINGLKEKGIAQTDLERLKRQLMGRHLSSFDSFEYTANRLISHYFNQTPYHSFLDLVERLNAEQVQQTLHEQLDWERSSVAILNPVQYND